MRAAKVRRSKASVWPVGCAVRAVPWLQRPQSEWHAVSTFATQSLLRAVSFAMQSNTRANGAANGYGRGNPRTACTLMTTSTAKRVRVMSGMRPTGRLHLGHLVGALTNWAELSRTADAFFEIADLHAFTTAYQSPEEIRVAREDMVRDWIAAGV